MRIYEFHFEGVWLGGKALVVAETEEAARELLVKTHGKKLGQYRSAGSIGVDAPEVVYYDDGDY